MREALGQRYRLEAEIHGEPGVFGAHDLETGARVAVKLFATVDSDAAFRREAYLAMRARHANLVGLLDAGVTDGRGWLVFDYVPGLEVRHRLRSYGPMGVRRALDVASQLFAALDALHRHGLAHGDIKPDNVLLEEGRVRVFDYGVGRVRPEVGTGGMYPGTPDYMHPALFRGGLPDAGTDCFAAWVTTYELLAGRRPYGVRTLRAPEPLPAPASVGDERLDRLLSAGLAGRLPDARGAWLAVTRYLAGRHDLPPLPPPARASEAVGAALAGHVRDGVSVAVVGGEDMGRVALEALHHAHVRAGGWALWSRAAWCSPDEPLSGALALAAEVTDALPEHVLTGVRDALGEHGELLARVVPAVRTWLGAPTRKEHVPADALERALARLLDACPRPLLVLVDGYDRLDAASRRLLTAHVAGRGLVLAGTLAPGSPHAMPVEVRLPDGDAPYAGDAGLSPAHAEIVAAARVLGLPLGSRLARALGVEPAVVHEAALEAEAHGAARWDGTAVIARPGPAPSPGEAAALYRAAAERLDAEAEPHLAARYVRLGRERRAP